MALTKIKFTVAVVNNQLLPYPFLTISCRLHNVESPNSQLQYEKLDADGKAAFEFTIDTNAAVVDFDVEGHHYEVEVSDGDHVMFKLYTASDANMFMEIVSPVPRDKN